MKSLRILLTILCLPILAFAFSDGNGSINNPYKVSTYQELDSIRYYLTSHFVLANNIDLANSPFDSVNSIGNEGWVPIGSGSYWFRGSLDGRGFSIDNLFIDRDTTDQVGLFKSVSNATIKNLRLTNCNIIGKSSAGGIVGYNGFSSMISDCYVEGKIKSLYLHAGGIASYNYKSTIANCTTFVDISSGILGGGITGGIAGGIVGLNHGSLIFRSFSSVNISSRVQAGGIAGVNSDTSQIIECYSLGSINCLKIPNDIKSGNSVGGITSMNLNNSLIKNCYSLATLSGIDYIAGITGSNKERSEIVNCFSSGSITTTNIDPNVIIGFSGGCVGITDDALASNIFYDYEASFVKEPSIAKTTTELKSKATFTSWDFDSIWTIVEGVDYPKLQLFKPDIPVMYSPEGDGTPANPYEISSLKDLLWLSNSDTIWSDSSYYIQTVNINAATTDTLNLGAGFRPIGNSVTPFIGIYNGNGHNISNLCINRPSTSDVGLFGSVLNSYIYKLAAIDVTITGEYRVGGFVGAIYGVPGEKETISSIISQVFTSGHVNGDSNIGGLAGFNGGSILDSYSYCAVSGIQNIGGIAGHDGWIGYTSKISNSYSFEGIYGNGGGPVINCYTNAEALKDTSTIIGWDFDSIWDISTNINFGYPHLRAFKNYYNSMLSITTVELNSYRDSSVIIVGNITNYDSTKIDENGFCWSLTNAIPTLDNQKIIIEDSTRYDTFSYKFSKMFCDSLYYARSYVIYENDTLYGDVLQFYTAPWKGLGTKEDPYLVFTASDMNSIRHYLSAHYVMMQDIDFIGTPYDSSATLGVGFRPIGTAAEPFTGSFNGNAHIIKHIYMKSPLADIGVFGYIKNSEIKRLGVEGSIKADPTKTTYYVKQGIGVYVGGIAGFVYNSCTIEESYFKGTIEGGAYNTSAGGITGYLYEDAMLKNCYSNVDSSLYSKSGMAGIAYGNYTKPQINNCYSNLSFGGGLISSSYFDSTMSGSSSSYGRSTLELYQDSTFVGWDFDTTWALDVGVSYPKLVWEVSDWGTYNIEDVSIADPVIELFEGDTFQLNYDIRPLGNDKQYTFNIGSLGIANVNSVGLITALLKGESYIYLKSVDDSTICDSMKIIVKSTYSGGSGTVDDPYQIKTAGDLHRIRYNKSSHFILMNDIDLLHSDYNATNTGGLGWEPIGTGWFKVNEVWQYDYFSGTFDGDGHVIKNLYINRRDIDGLGFFGEIIHGEIKDLGIEGTVYGGFGGENPSAGGIACNIEDASISRCYFKGNVVGFSSAGGICAFSTRAIITDCYAKGELSSSWTFGGLYEGAGFANTQRCYSSFTIGGVDVGFANSLTNGGTIVDSYFELNDTTITPNGYAKPLDSTKMKDINSFENWDFQNIWTIRDTDKSPIFTWEDSLWGFYPIDSIILNDSTVTIIEGSKDTIGYVLKPFGSNKKMTFVSMDSSIFTVDTLGIVSAYSVGSAMLFVSSIDDSTIKDSLRVIVEEDLTSVNNAPILTQVSNTITREGTPITLTIDMVIASDTENDTLLLVINSGENYTVNGLIVTPIANFYGTLNVPISVTDGNLISNEMIMEIEVTPINDVPVLSQIKDTTTLEDTSIKLSMDMVSTSDTENDELSLVITDGDYYTVVGLIVIPVANFYGTLNVPISVTDGNLISNEMIMEIEVTPVNDIPTISLLDGKTYTITNDSLLTILASDFVIEDGDGDNLAIVIARGSNCLIDGQIITVDSTFAGVATVLAYVSDGTINSDTIIVNITVTEPVASSVLTISPMAKNGYSLRVAPTPTKHAGKIIFTSDVDGEAVFTIYTINETKVATTKTDVIYGEEQILDWGIISKLSKGIYFIEMKVDGERKAVSRIVKIKK